MGRLSCYVDERWRDNMVQNFLRNSKLEGSASESKPRLVIYNYINKYEVTMDPQF